MNTIKFSSILKCLTIILVFSSFNAFAHWGSKGPYGGSISAMLTVDTNVYVGTYDGGVFRSTNRNLTAWTVRNNGLPSGKISSFTNIGTTVFVGTLDHGIYKTTDIGANWVAVNNGLTVNHAYTLAVSGTTLYAGTIGGGVFRSTDNGNNWTQVNTGLGNLFVFSLVTSGTTVYAGTDNGVYVSTDNGDNWTMVNTNLTDTFVYTLTLSGSNIYAGTESGVFSSPVSSISWTLENTGLNTPEALTLYAYNGNVYVGTYSGLYMSSDAGALSWTAQNTGGLADDSVTAVTYINNRFVVGTKDAGVFRTSSSSINWAAHNNGINNLETRTFFAEGSLIISATNWGLYVSRDVASSYVRANNGLTDSLHVNSLLFIGTTLYAGTENHGVFVSADTGRTWTAANNGLTHMGIQHLIAYGSQLAAISVDGDIFTTSTSAINWIDVAVTFPSAHDITAVIPNSTAIYASTYGDGVYIFNGVSWSAVNTGLTNLYVSDMVIKGSKIYASTLGGGGIFVSELSSISWTAMNTGLPDENVYALGVTDQYVVAGLIGMVYATDDDAQSWLPTNVQLNLPAFSEITGIGFTSARVFVSTSDNSLYSNAKSELPNYVTSVLNPGISTRNATEILLYPNPSTGAFNIALTQSGEVLTKVTVTSVDGIVLYEASSTELLPVLKKGAYIITVVTNQGVSVQKLLVQ